ncbi:MAG: DMT family transporter [Spirochaetes bacterium]|nr:DMT family transporter [Spirochaetota bacterium]
MTEEKNNIISNNSFGKINIKDLFITIFAPILWSLGGPGIRLVSVSPWTIIFFRSISMSITIFFFIIMFYRKNCFKVFKDLGIEGTWVSILLALTTFFYVLSISKTTVANALLLQGTAPIWATLFGYILLKEKINFSIILSLFFSFFGIILILFNKNETSLLANLNENFFSFDNFFKATLSGKNLLGNIFALITGFCLAGQILIIRKNPTINLIPATVVGGLFAAILSLFFRPEFYIKFKDFTILLFLGAIQIGLGYILFYRGSKNLPVNLSSLITLLETLLGPLWVFLIFGEYISKNTIIGGIIILISLIINLYSYKLIK